MTCVRASNLKNLAEVILHECAVSSPICFYFSSVDFLQHAIWTGISSGFEIEGEPFFEDEPISELGFSLMDKACNHDYFVTFGD